MKAYYISYIKRVLREDYNKNWPKHRPEVERDNELNLICKALDRFEELQDEKRRI